MDVTAVIELSSVPIFLLRPYLYAWDCSNTSTNGVISVVISVGITVALADEEDVETLLEAYEKTL